MSSNSSIDTINSSFHCFSFLLCSLYGTLLNCVCKHFVDRSGLHHWGECCTWSCRCNLVGGHLLCKQQCKYYPFSARFMLNSAVFIGLGLTSFLLSFFKFFIFLYPPEKLLRPKWVSSGTTGPVPAQCVYGSRAVQSGGMQIPRPLSSQSTRQWCVPSPQPLNTQHHQSRWPPEGYRSTWPRRAGSFPRKLPVPVLPWVQGWGLCSERKRAE